MNIDPRTGVITLMRGDTLTIPLLINIGTKVSPVYKKLTENDRLYFALMEPHQAFEDAIVKKIFDSNSETDADGNVLLKLSSKDTEYLSVGKYYYMVKLRTIDDTNEENVTTVIPTTLFWLEGNNPKRESVQSGQNIQPYAVTYTPQLLTGAQKAQARENIDAVSSSDVSDQIAEALSTINPEKEIFVATYDTTTFEEIAEAVSIGKYCVCYYDNTYYTLTFFASGAPFLLFGAPYAMNVSDDTAPSVKFLNLDRSNNTWSNGTYSLVTEDTVATAVETEVENYLENNPNIIYEEYTSVTSVDIHTAITSGKMLVLTKEQDYYFLTQIANNVNTDLPPEYMFVCTKTASDGRIVIKRIAIDTAGSPVELEDVFIQTETENNIFFAEYDVTPTSEVFAAKNAGKACFCIYNNSTYSLNKYEVTTGETGTTHELIFQVVKDNIVYSIGVSYLEGTDGSAVEDYGWAVKEDLILATNAQIGDIETALDSIISIQNALIGGDSV